MSADIHQVRSAIERRPADVVSQSLIIQDQIADRIRELFALPAALKSPDMLALAIRSGCTRGPDCVGCRTEFVCRDMCYRCGLAGSIRGVPSGPAQLSCRSLCMASRRAGLGHRNFAARPCPSLLNCVTRPRVRRRRRLKEVQDVFRTRCGPQGEQLMVGVGERPPAADGDEAMVAVFREDHGYTFLLASARRPGFSRRLGVPVRWVDTAVSIPQTVKSQ